MTDLILQDLMRDEGTRLRPYRDTTGHLTIGIGRNLDAKGISEDEAIYLCQHDITEAALGLDRALPQWRAYSEGWRRALVNMAFNLGVEELMAFHHLLNALSQGNGMAAAQAAMDSLWARQVGQRADRVAKLFAAG